MDLFRCRGRGSGLCSRFTLGLQWAYVNRIGLGCAKSVWKIQWGS